MFKNFLAFATISMEFLIIESFVELFWFIVQ